jgi:hypothetical protein
VTEERDWPEISLVGPGGAPIDLQANRPHPARIYDYFLGGKDNFPADRAAAAAGLRANPNARIPPVQNRAFMRRAVAYLAREAGISQFLDIGTGIPTSPNVHEIAQQINPQARIVYVDNDPMVLAHARAQLASGPDGMTVYIDADVRDPDRILGSPDLRDTLDLSRPVALLMLALLPSIPDSDDPLSIARRLTSSLASGSYLALSHLTGDFDPAPWERIESEAASRGVVIRPRTRACIERFFTGFDLVEPGLVSLPDWRPDPDAAGDRPTDAHVSVFGGVARKP